jgi:16S rRNA (cytosine967-C5)-methyltransferase
MTRHPRRRYAPAPDTPGVAARRAALRLLDAVLRRGEPLEIALHAATQGLPDRADRALAHAIVAEVLRHLSDLDALIDGATPRPLPADAKARMVLRLALAQVLRLGTPDHAAVATALPLVEGGPRKLVHGVLGTLLRGGAALPDPPTLPAGVAERWRANWGEAMVAGAAAALGTRPPLDLGLRDPGATNEWAERLSGISLAPGHVRLADPGDVAALPGYGEGAWWVQDIAASLPARLLGAGEGRTVLDLCAAPGGKTMQLAAAGWRVTAVDQSARRLDRLADNLRRTGLAAQAVQADLRAWAPDAQADAVLLDAPCTATGIFRRHPDVLHRIGARQIAELADLQAQLLARAADWVRPGGRLVYATCSLEPEEGEAQIAAFLAARPDYAPAPPEPGERPEGLATPGSFVRTLPTMLAGEGRCDGFFVARLVRATAG